MGDRSLDTLGYSRGRGARYDILIYNSPTTVSAQMSIPFSERARVRRVPKRAVYEPEKIREILDEALISHVGFMHAGHPVVIPTLHVRRGDQLLLHGSSAGRTMRTLAAGAKIAVTATLVDGLVLARSAFHHSVNYRSVVIFGCARELTGERERLQALEAFLERFASGRWESVRKPSARELKATCVLSLPLTEASAKVRTGPPVDDPQDYQLDVWAGVIPLRLERQPPIEDPARTQQLAAR